MPAQYTQLDGRHWCNEDFVSQVRKMYPATTKKIPLGYSTYTGWTGKDEILFTKHDPLNDLASFEGQLYEASFDMVASDNFKKKILDQVKYTEPAKESREASEQLDPLRKRKAADLTQAWGMTLDERLEQSRLQKQARRGGGLYGYPKPIVSSCESAAKRLNRRAASLMHKMVRKDRNVVAFLQTHAKRSSSSAARVLLAAYRSSLPQVDFDEGLDTVASVEKEAASRYGMYGYRAKTANLGLSACTSIKEAAGTLASDLHRRKATLHQRITSFLGEHSKTSNCIASHLILSCYPDPDVSFRRASTGQRPPKTVDEWLAWDVSADAV